MTHPRQRFCARLLTLHKELSVRMVTVSRSGFWLRTQSEQFRSAIVSGLGDHKARDEHFLSLFQVL